VKNTLGFEPKFKIKDGVEELINAFKYVSYSELTNQKLPGKYKKLEKIIKT